MERRMVKIGDIRTWLRPRGYSGEYHTFMVVDVQDVDWSKSRWCTIMYPNGTYSDIYEHDLFKDPDDPCDDEYSVGLDEIQVEKQDVPEEKSE